MLVCKGAYINFSDIDPPLTSCAMFLLQEFEDVFTGKLPRGLPPIKDIEYKIDFVLRAAISNQPAYKTNFEESKEP